MSKPYGEVNVALFQEIKKKILEEPRRLRMGGWWVEYPEETVRQFGDILPPCGTAACIAGWAMLINGARPDPYQSFNAKKAAELLGISDNYESIFFFGQWPKEFRDKYLDDSSLKGQAKATAEFIDYICGEKTNV